MTAAIQPALDGAALIKLEVAYDILGVSRKGFKGLVRNGHLPPPIKVAGRRYMLSTAALEAFIRKLNEPSIVKPGTDKPAKPA